MYTRGCVISIFWLRGIMASIPPNIDVYVYDLIKDFKLDYPELTEFEIQEKIHQRFIVHLDEFRNQYIKIPISYDIG